MAAITVGLIWTIVINIIILAIVSLPLYIAVKLIGGKTGIIKVIITNVIAGIIMGILRGYLPDYGTLVVIITLIALFFVYKIMFDIGWIKAFFAWFLQGIIVFILYWLVNKLSVLLGINIVAVALSLT